MDNKNKSKLIVIGFISFVVIIYTASYFYTLDKNNKLLSSPRLVMLLAPEQKINDQFSLLNIEGRRSLARLMYKEGLILSISQSQFDSGNINISDHYQDKIQDRAFTVIDCMDYSEILEKTMQVTDKNNLKANWAFSACGVN